MTEREIDEFKNNLSRERQQLSSDCIKARIELFIEMINQYKIEHPTHTKCIERWRNWYKLVKEEIYKKHIPQNEIELLQYHLESFKVENTDIAVKRLQNWINRITVNYTLDDKIVERINVVLNKYGYKY